ncbi:2-(3-amino-3-carboxypropyl)histidine synthase subunit 2 isoform X1 [Conger conger]|nr:2-(3-amino-3-carboxypropyl)histidine synthase subunit 2 isoform X1 [Conger conger]XP_061094319.1 2-(3-amino-3-carboxypropyl)histidine synthase subunit 2 isoform X1 [Conger conger]XP_061094320.1 2-(3-amino-3-carboxypropyl)histidine synthase subunit 2 isoform X1 [Conger conger]XP_061094321.1 2-(3-amino-3-carboxypropyl)histidine synthase subunit 2 isoform X1 [Conger conger]
MDILEEIYEIKKTCDFIKNNNFDKVALQFPDDLLVDSVQMASEIERETEAKLYILGDTSYGSCCVDEVAAEHVGAQCIIHYGRACLSPARRLPLMYVFGKRPVDLQKCASSFNNLYPDRQSHIIILYDVTYCHIIDDLLEVLSPQYPNVVKSTLRVDGNQCYILRSLHGQHVDSESTPTRSHHDGHKYIHKFGREFILKEGYKVEDYSMFYIGQEGATLTNFMMTWNHCSFSSFDPVTSVWRRETVNINRALMKRYYLIERARDADVVGILVGTLGVASYLKIIDQLKNTVRKAGKKIYVFAMGKLNVPKLANFLEIDIYILVACPESSLLDSSEFYRPVVTPFEMEVACNKHQEWTGQYVTDFRDLLPGACSHVNFPSPEADENDGEEVDVSLITGSLRSTYFSSSLPVDDDTSVVQRNKTLTVAHNNSAASFLQGRTWQGLEQKLGKTAVVKAVEGRRGIAIAYEEEGKN